MLDKVILFSLRNRILVLSVTAIILVYGLIVLQKLPVDVFPDLNRPTVHVITDVHGMAPEEVEVVVTRPIESVLNGMPGVTRIYSSSATGLSVVRVEFDWGTDLRFARLTVSERLQLARSRMPKDISPLLSPSSSILGEIQMIGLTSEGDKTDGIELRSIADWTIRPKLLTIPGVSQVTVLGGGQRQVQILFNADKLRKKQISIQSLKEKISQISGASGGGFITSGDKEWLIRNFGRIRNHEEISQTAIGMHFGIPVLLKDIAQVEFAPAPKRGDASVSGNPGVVLMVQKQASADTIRVSHLVDEALKEIQSRLTPDVKIHPELFKQANFIKLAITNVEEALRDGSIMVALILILFLLNFRTTAITLTAIPISHFSFLFSLFSFLFSQARQEALDKIVNAFNPQINNYNTPQPAPNFNPQNKRTCNSRKDYLGNTVTECQDGF